MNNVLYCGYPDCYNIADYEFRNLKQTIYDLRCVNHSIIFFTFLTKEYRIIGGDWQVINEGIKQRYNKELKKQYSAFRPPNKKDLLLVYEHLFLGNQSMGF